LHGPELAALSGSILFPQSASGAFTSIRLDSMYFALFRLREIRLRFGGVNTTNVVRYRGPNRKMQPNAAKGMPAISPAQSGDIPVELGLTQAAAMLSQGFHVRDRRLYLRTGMEIERR
jgi:hypothetical protein